MRVLKVTKGFDSIGRVYVYLTVELAGLGLRIRTIHTLGCEFKPYYAIEESSRWKTDNLAWVDWASKEHYGMSTALGARP